MLPDAESSSCWPFKQQILRMMPPSSESPQGLKVCPFFSYKIIAIVKVCAILVVTSGEIRAYYRGWCSTKLIMAPSQDTMRHHSKFDTMQCLNYAVLIHPYNLHCEKCISQLTFSLNEMIWDLKEVALPKRAVRRSDDRWHDVFAQHHHVFMYEYE